MFNLSKISKKITTFVKNDKRLAFEIMFAAILCISTVGVFYTWLSGFVERNSGSLVLGAATDLPAGRRLEAADFTLVKVINEYRPVTAFNEVDAEKLIGNTLISNLSKNQLITSNDVLVGRTKNTVGLLIDENKKGMVLSTSWLSGSYPSLKRGDTISFLTLTRGVNGLPGAARTIATGVEVIDIVAGNEKEPSSLFLKLDPTLAANLLSLHATPGTLIQVLVDGYKPINDAK